MQATQSRTASELVGRSTGFRAFESVSNGVAGIAEGARLAHDAGNLLGALSLYSELLAMPGVLNEEHRGFAAELQLLSDRSWAMISRLVDHAGVEEAIPATVGAVLPEMVERCRGVLGRVAGRVVEVSYGAGAYESVGVGAEAVERILTNLVKNAAEATTGEGSILVVVEGVLGDARRRVVMTVRDTGCGMSSAAVERLMRAGGISSTGGRGLGFRVVRELVAMSGGCLNVESEPGVGTSISVEWYALEAADDWRAKNLSGNCNCPQKEIMQKTSEIQGSLHCGGKNAAFGRDDVLMVWVVQAMTTAKAKYRGLSTAQRTMKPCAAPVEMTYIQNLLRSR